MSPLFDHPPPLLTFYLPPPLKKVSWFAYFQYKEEIWKLRQAQKLPVDERCIGELFLDDLYKWKGPVPQTSQPDATAPSSCQRDAFQGTSAQCAFSAGSSKLLCKTLSPSARECFCF